MGVCRNIQNQDVYEYLGENKFINLRTKKEGVVDDDTARKIFKINLDATELIMQYPMIKELIYRLNLKFHNK